MVFSSLVRSERKIQHFFSSLLRMTCLLIGSFDLKHHWLNPFSQTHLFLKTTDCTAKTMSRYFEPYVDNGGYEIHLISYTFSTTLAFPGKDYVIVAGDTRMSSGYSILTRHSSKMCKLYCCWNVIKLTHLCRTDKCVLVTAGMQSDTKTLHKLLKTRLAW